MQLCASIDPIHHNFRALYTLYQYSYFQLISIEKGYSEVYKTI